MSVRVARPGTIWGMSGGRHRASAGGHVFVSAGGHRASSSGHAY